MRKRLLRAIAHYSALAASPEPRDRAATRAVIERLLTEISFMQHERLIHLLVTLFFAAVLAMFFILSLLTADALILAAFVLTLIVEIFYVRHYFCLENGVQRLYEIYDRLLTNLG